MLYIHVLSANIKDICIRFFYHKTSIQFNNFVSKDFWESQDFLQEVFWLSWLQTFYYQFSWKPDFINS